MNLATGIVFVAMLAGLHLWWRNRYRLLRDDWVHEKTSRESSQTRYYQEAMQMAAEQQAVFNSMVEGVLILDEHARIQLINRSLQDLFGLKADVRGQTIMEAFRVQELVEIVKRLQEEQVVRAYELELTGIISRWAEVNAAIVGGHAGTRRGYIMVFHDLTRLKELERTRQDFVANVSHELRTPLSLIKGFAETLLDGAKENPELTTRFLGTIAKHTDRLTYLIEDLLTISQIESGKIVISPHELDLKKQAQTAIEDLQSRALEKNITIANNIPEMLMGNGDADRLDQVFFNLVDNAIKYGKADGHVIVDGRVNEKELVELCVQDDGPGIPAEAQARVFERFFRVDRARSRDTGGTGLGLAIVKHIIHGHGGEVWLKSEPGQGCKFYFTLPKA